MTEPDKAQGSTTDRENSYKSPRRVAAFMLGCIAVFVICLAGWRIYQSLLAQHWPSTQGTVLSCRIWRNPNPGRGQVEDNCSMQYAYVISGMRYKSTAIASDTDNDTELTIARDHPPGTTVRVFYNPTRPENSYLASSISINTILYFLVGASLLAASWALFVRSR
jgi:hypothetical protein